MVAIGVSIEIKLRLDGCALLAMNEKYQRHCEAFAEAISIRTNSSF